MLRADDVLACCLEASFDPLAIEAELDALVAAPWTRHFNVGVFDGEWTGLALRSPGGDPARIYPDLTDRCPIEDTGLAAALPATRALLGSLGRPLLAVRFLRLAPGARIHPHRDDDLGLDRGEARLHAVIRTHPEVRFVVGGVRLAMRPGELWYADFSREHAVENRSPIDRIHLVIDCIADVSLREAIARSPSAIPRISAS